MAFDYYLYSNINLASARQGIPYNVQNNDYRLDHYQLNQAQSGDYIPLAFLTSGLFYLGFAQVPPMAPE